MSKFGEIIQGDIPIMLCFYTPLLCPEGLIDNIRSIAAEVGIRAKVVLIEMPKNVALCNALHITSNPTFMFYNRQELESRINGTTKYEPLLIYLEELING